MLSLAEFLDASPTAFHAAATIARELSGRGWTELKEGDSWSLEKGKGYFSVRSGRSVAAFIPGPVEPAESGLRLTASHLDSPVWKVKTDAFTREDGAWRYPVERYGGPINRTWLDRELEAAGIVHIAGKDGKPEERLWRSGKPVAVIPSLAIHFDRDVNKGVELNAQQHMAALMPPGADESGDSRDPLSEVITNDIGCGADDILASEIYLVPHAAAGRIGEDGNGWVVSGRLDNLAMAHAMLEALPDPPDIGAAGVAAFWFDAEEIGSRTESGAASAFPGEMIERIVLASGGSREDLLRCRRNSILLSADMAHARHPSYADRHDKGYPAAMGKGPVIKTHGQRHYATESGTEARLVALARKSGIETQKFIMRSDLPCGSSLGPLASSATAIPAADVGNPLWGMHSARETVSMADHGQMIRLMREHWTN